jgi:hypothetical protein
VGVIMGTCGQWLSVGRGTQYLTHLDVIMGTCGQWLSVGRGTQYLTHLDESNQQNDEIGCESLLRDSHVNPLLKVLHRQHGVRRGVKQVRHPDPEQVVCAEARAACLFDPRHKTSVVRCCARQFSGDDGNGQGVHDAAEQKSREDEPEKTSQ